MLFRSLGGLEFDKINIHCPVDEPSVITISGTMAHYYVKKFNIDAQLRSVSIGGSVLRVHQIRDYRTSPKVNDVCVNINIVKALIGLNHAVIDIETMATCVKMKYNINRSSAIGPSMCLGCNGGFQYIGGPKHISESLSSLFALMSRNMRTQEFLQAILQSRSMVKYIYPSGVKKTRNYGKSIGFNSEPRPIDF